MTDSIQRRQQHGNDERNAFLPRRTGLNAAWCGYHVRAVFGDTPARCAVEQHVNDVLFVRREFLGRRPSLVLRGNSLLEVDDDTPAKVKLLVVHFDKTAWLEERQGVGRMRDDLTEVRGQLIKLLATFIVLRNEVFIGYHRRTPLFFLLFQFCIIVSAHISKMMRDSYRLPRVEFPHYFGIGRNTARA